MVIDRAGHDDLHDDPDHVAAAVERPAQAPVGSGTAVLASRPMPTTGDDPQPERARRVAVVGAGFSGLAAARVLDALGMDLVVYDRSPDVGGVWSTTRRYPGMRTQNDKGTYCFSELPMPREYPEWPDADQVQAYLEQYVAVCDLAGVVRLGTEVVRASPEPEGAGWSLELRRADGATAQDRCDHLVVANGIFSEPHIPDLAGREDFEAAGGRVVAAGTLDDVEQARDRDVLGIGYGKSRATSACRAARWRAAPPSWLATCCGRCRAGSRGCSTTST